MDAEAEAEAEVSNTADGGADVSGAVDADVVDTDTNANIKRSIEQAGERV